MDPLIKQFSDFIGNIFLYAIKKPIWSMAIIRSKLFNWENFLHQRRIWEYNELSSSVEESLYDAFSINRSTLYNIFTSKSVRKLTEEIQNRSKYYNELIPIPAIYDSNINLAIVCYTICRLLMPRIVIETGVARGITSAFILQALEENAKGQLYSVDLPLPRVNAQLFIGILVPQHLRHRWKLILGDSLYMIPKIPDKHVKIDLFLHDSNHSYLHQILEYTLAYDKLRPGGVLLSDDVHNSDAFIKFTNKVKSRSYVIKKYNNKGVWGFLLK